VPDLAPVALEEYEWRHERLVSADELTRWDPERGDSLPAERFRCFVLVRSQHGEGWGSIADGRLPLPTDLGGPELPFRRAVDAYLATHGGTKKACFEAVADITGNSPGTLAMRYSRHGDHVWRFAAPL
jgi:hypothetical protein